MCVIKRWVYAQKKSTVYFELSQMGLWERSSCKLHGGKKVKIKLKKPLVNQIILYDLIKQITSRISTYNPVDTI